MPTSSGKKMSYDALMRWEWEGGTPAPGSEPARATPAEHTDTLQLANRRRHGRQAPAVSTLPADISQGDIRER